MRTGLARIAAIATALAGCAGAVELKREAAQAFDRYVRQAESRIESQTGRTGGFLFATTPERRASLRSGSVLVEPRLPGGELKVASALIHDWTGGVFIPDASVRDVVALLEAYDRHKEFFQPEVIDSRVLSREGGDFRVALRLLKKKVLTVVLDTEHRVHYERESENHWRSWSRSTRIVEVENPGTRGERALPPGTGHGYLWRLNSYWAFHELDGGAYVECEAISLSRDVPRSSRWLIEPIIRTLPPESLANTLRATRAGVLRGGGGR
jgi:hypothetical protein